MPRSPPEAGQAVSPAELSEGDALRRSELLKGAILNAALDCIISIDSRSCVVEWNPAAERTFGYLREEVFGRDLTELIIPPEHREAHRKGMARFLATGHGPVLQERIEIDAMRADGRRFPVELAINAIQLGEEPHFTAYLRDISDRRAAEKERHEAEQRLKATYEYAFVAIGEVDLEGRFLRVNEQFCQITGYTREELLARTFLDITHPDDRESDRERFLEQMSGARGVYAREKRYVHKSGHVVWVDLLASRVDDGTGAPAYGVRVVRDITDRKRAEERQRLLVNELNHRVKNTLATVQSIALQTLRNAESAAEAKDALESRLLALSRAHDVLTRESWEGIALSEIVAEALEPYANRHNDRWEVTGPDVQITPRTALALAMALQELATNAAKYGALSSASGRVRVSWQVDNSVSPSRLRLEWLESGGPPVQMPKRRGFGARLIERSLAQELNGTATLEFRPEGLRCSVDAPLP